jgi:hypothetical protein
MYRYNNAIDRGRKTVQLSIAIMTVWMAMCVFVFKIISLSLNMTNLSTNIDFNWNAFSTWGIVISFTLFGAFIYGFHAFNTELKDANKIINNLFVTNNNNEETDSMLRRLNEVTNDLENHSVKSSALNLISVMLIFFSFLNGFFSAEQVISGLAKYDFILATVVSMMILLFVGYYQKIILWWISRKKCKN